MRKKCVRLESNYVYVGKAKNVSPVWWSFVQVSHKLCSLSEFCLCVNFSSFFHKHLKFISSPFLLFFGHRKENLKITRTQNEDLLMNFAQKILMIFFFAPLEPRAATEIYAKQFCSKVEEFNWNPFAGRLVRFVLSRECARGLRRENIFIGSTLILESICVTNFFIDFLYLVYRITFYATFITNVSGRWFRLAVPIHFCQFTSSKN